MNDIMLLLVETGSQSLGALWLPLILWTWTAMTAWLVLTWFKKMHPLYQYHFRVALLAGIPLSIAVSWLFDLATPFLANLEGGFRTTLLLIQNPIQYESLQATTVSYWDVSNPYLWIGLVILLLFTVSVFKTARLFVRYGSLYRFVKNTQTYYLREFAGIEGPNGLLNRKRTGEVKLAFSATIQTPFTFGWRNPVILLPQNLKGSSGQLRMVLHHELVHIKRTDFITDAIVQLVKTFFWFHPLVQLLARDSELYREISCDSEVLASPAVSKRQYAKLLLMLIPGKPGAEELPAAGILSPYNIIEKRLRVMKEQPQNKERNSTGKSILFSTFLAITISGLIGCTDIQSPEANQAKKVDWDQQFIELIIPPNENVVIFDDIKMTIPEFEAEVRDHGNTNAIFNFRVDPNAPFGKVTDVEGIMRNQLSPVRVNYRESAEPR